MSAVRTVITGAGVVSPLGIGRADFGKALCAGRTALAPSAFASHDGYPLLAARVPAFDVEPFLKGRKAYLDPAAEFALGAMALCIEDAGFDRQQLFEAGLVFGSAYGCLQTMELFYQDVREKGPRYAKPFLFPHTYPNTAVSLAAIEFEISGPHLHFASGFTSSAQAVAAACRLIQDRQAPAVFCGGYEALNETLMTGAELSGELSLAEQAGAAAGPFGYDRDGYFAAEGAAVFCVESLDSARKRNAHILAEIKSVALSADHRINDPAGDGAGIAGVLRGCLDGIVAPGLSGVILPAANGSLPGDRSEAIGIDAALKSIDARMPVCPLKGLTGEAMGAGTAFQLAAALAILERRTLPAAARAQDIDPELPVDLTDSSTDASQLTVVCVNSIDAGGNIVVLALSGPEAQA